MADLGDTTPATVKAINAACEAKYAAEMREDATLRMSSIGKACDRALWLALRWSTPRKPVEARITRVFQNGHDRESRIVEMLALAGLKVQAVDPVTGGQWRVELADGDLIGHADGKITGIPESPVTPHLLEIKTMNAKRWATFRSKGVKASDPQYWVQAQCYAHGLGLTRILFVCENQDTKEIWTERLHVDLLAAANVEAKALRITRAIAPPEGISQDPKFYQCLFCASHGLCHKQERARRNCRTCIAFDFASKTCQRHGDVRDLDAQRAGCDVHLYIPELVHGEQIDASEQAGTVTYRMPDGSIWTDGVVAT